MSNTAAPNTVPSSVNKSKRSEEGSDSGMLTPETLVERLRLSSAGVVEDLYNITFRQLQSESEREARLDNKAQALLVTSGLSVTVAFTFGGFILQHADKLKLSPLVTDTLGSSVMWVVAGLYLGALLLGLVTSALAVCALRVISTYRTISEEDVFDISELAAAEEEFKAEIGAGGEKGPDYKRANERAQARLRRHLVAHCWQIWQQHLAIHEKKAKTIAIGQLVFLLFLGLLFVIGVFIGLSVI